MNEFIYILKKSKLFDNVSEDEIRAMLSCLEAKALNYKKGEYVLRQGEYLNAVTVLVKGKLLIQKDDYWGNRSILGNIECGEMFGEAYAAPGSGPLLNDVAAVA